MRRRPGLGEYIERRLGRGATTQLRNLLVRPLGAASFSRFWRYWNPVYGYFLSYYAYRPLRLVFPRPVAVLLTFVGCGFVLHDLVGWAVAGHARFAEMTAMFALFGVGVVLSDALRLDLAHYPSPSGLLPTQAASLLRWRSSTCLLQRGPQRHSRARRRSGLPPARACTDGSPTTRKEETSGSWVRMDRARGN